MRLDEVRRRELAATVFESVGASANPVMLMELVGLEAVSRMPANLNGFQTAEWIVDYALTSESPDVFIHIVKSVDKPGALTEVHRVVAEIEADPSRWSATDAFGALWAPPDWPFLDRESLRAVLNTMADGGGPPSISIDGAVGHGKRTITTYIRQLAEQKHSFRTVAAELRREPGVAVLPALVTDLRLKLNLDHHGPTTHEEPERQGEIFARDLAHDALKAPGPVWLLANVLEPSGVDRGTMRFVDESIRLLAVMPQLRSKLRVVVLSEAVSLLGLKNLPPVEHRHTLLDIDKQAVTKWLAAAVPGRAEDLYDLTTEVLFRRLDEVRPAPADRLRTLAFHCARAHRTLAAAQIG